MPENSPGPIDETQEFDTTLAGLDTTQTIPVEHSDQTQPVTNAEHEALGSDTEPLLSEVEGGVEMQNFFLDELAAEDEVDGIDREALPHDTQPLTVPAPMSGLDRYLSDPDVKLPINYDDPQRPADSEVSSPSRPVLVIEEPPVEEEDTRLFDPNPLNPEE